MKIRAPALPTTTEADVLRRRAAEARELEVSRRGAVLGCIRLQYPLPTSYSTIEAMMLAAYVYDIPLLEADLGYLRQKGYILVGEADIGGAVLRTYTLTPAGYDLYQGVTADPGILIVRG